MTHSIRNSALIAAACSIMAGCQMNHHETEERSMPLSSTPPAVQAAIKKAIGTNEIENLARENEDGQEVFEASFDDAKGMDCSVTVTPDGAIVEEETEVKVADLTPAVAAGVLKVQPLAQVKEASQVKRAGNSYYEVDAMVGEEKHEIAIAQDGQLISDKVESDEGGYQKDKDEKSGDKD